MSPADQKVAETLLKLLGWRASTISWGWFHIEGGLMCASFEEAMTQEFGRNWRETWKTSLGKFD